MQYLGVAQFGSVLEWGSRGRKFESSHPDQQKPRNHEKQVISRLFCAQLCKVFRIFILVSVFYAHCEGIVFDGGSKMVVTNGSKSPEFDCCFCPHHAVVRASAKVLALLDAWDEIGGLFCRSQPLSNQLCSNLESTQTRPDNASLPIKNSIISSQSSCEILIQGDPLCLTRLMPLFSVLCTLLVCFCATPPRTS